MSENNIVQMLEALKNSGKGNTPFYLAKVVSLEPLTVSLNNLVVKKKLLINPSFLICSSSDIEKLFPTLPEHTEIEKFIKNFFKKYFIAPGDDVLVFHFQEENSFYILEKVVRA